MESTAKQRSRRRERAVRLQKEAAQDRHRTGRESGEEEEGDESPVPAKPPPRPPTRKKKAKEPIMEEDIIDGFCILSFKSYEDLECTLKACDNNAKNNLITNELLNSVPTLEEDGKICNRNRDLLNNKINNNHIVSNKVHIPHNDTRRAREDLNIPQRCASRNQLSDASSNSSSGRGYMCDSESEDDRGSDAGSDLFSTSVHKREFPSLPGETLVNKVSQPVVQNGPQHQVVQNGPLHPIVQNGPLHQVIQNGPLHQPVQNGPLHPVVQNGPHQIIHNGPSHQIVHHQKNGPSQQVPQKNGPPHPVVQKTGGAPHPVVQKNSSPHPVVQKSVGLPHPVVQKNGPPQPVIQNGPPHQEPFQNGPLHAEPSAAVAAVTATSSGPNPLAAVVASTCPQEPPPACSPTPVPSSTSPSGGVLPHSQSPFLHQRESPLPVIITAIVTTTTTSTTTITGSNNVKAVTHSNGFPNNSFSPASANKSNGPSFLSNHCSAPQQQQQPNPLVVQNHVAYASAPPPPPISTTTTTTTTNTITTGTTAKPVVSPAYVGQTSGPLSSSSPNTSSGQPPPAPLPPPERTSLFPFVSHSHPYTRGPSPLTTTSVPLIPPSSSSSSLPASTVCPISTCASLAIAPPPSHHSIQRLRRSPTPSVVVVSTPHPHTPTPTHGRDSHSSHSNSSLSSLSQLSQSLPSGGSGKEVTNNRSRSSSRNTTPSISSAAAPCCVYTAATYGASNSLTSLVFSKPHHSWNSASSNPILATANGPHLTSPPPNPASLSLAHSLHNSHHSSPFGPHATPPSALHPGAGHPGMFAPPLPPAASLTSSGLSLGGSTGPSPFGGDSLFVQPNGAQRFVERDVVNTSAFVKHYPFYTKIQNSAVENPKNQDLLRRELDTRFLASQDRSINIPPPPYMRTEMHQHQHTHMHQHSPFLPPPLGGALLPQASPHLYDKFPKLDSSFYSRNALGLPGYPSLSPLFAPGAASAAATPFAPPGHLAAFQPKMNPLVKSKTMKSGRWCAMHVRIAWEIYHHQQKQQQSEVHKTGATPSAAAAVAAAAAKPTADLLRPHNHLFQTLHRPHDLTFSSSLLGAAASTHGRTPFDTHHPHNTFLSAGAAHLGVSPFARTGYPGFGTPGTSFGGLGTLAGLASSSMFGNRDLGPACLTAAQDPWSRLHRAAPTFASPAAASTSPWGGLKAEAERERLQREEPDREKQRKAELEKERRDKEAEKNALNRDKREPDRQKDRDRMFHHVTTPSADSLRNGDLTTDRARDRERDWERTRERREASRSPIRASRDPSGSNNSSSSSNPKVDSAFEISAGSSSSAVAASSEVKVKEEKKEEESSGSRDPPTVSTRDMGISERERIRHHEQQPPPPSSTDSLSRSLVAASSLAAGMNPLDRARGVVGPLGLGHGLAPDRSAATQVPPFWGPLPPTAASTTSVTGDHFRSLDFHPARGELDRDQLMQRYSALSAVMPLPPDRFRDSEFVRQLAGDASARDLDRQLQLQDRERQAAYERSKLPPPPLRPNDPPYVPPPGLPSAAAAAGGIFSSLANPYLNSFCGGSSRNKSSSPGNPGNGIPPPLIPCTGPGGGAGVVSNHSGQVGHGTTPPLHHKLDSSHDPYFPKDRRGDVTSHPAELDSQSR